MVRPAARREAAGHIQKQFSISERRACRTMALHRSSKRYDARPRDDQAVRKRLKKLAAEKPRYGCPRLYEILRRDGIVVNHKKVHSIYLEEGLQVRRKSRRKRLRDLRMPLATATGSNQRWSIDFVSDQLADGRRFRVCTLVDDYSRRCLAAEVGLSIMGSDDCRILTAAAERAGGKPEAITCDNGPEFAGRTVQMWAQEQNVRINFIEPGKLMQNAYIESFNGKFRDECLNENWFTELETTREIIAAYVVEYNSYRPHSALGGQTPDEFLRKEVRLPMGSQGGETACQNA